MMLFLCVCGQAASTLISALLVIQHRGLLTADAVLGFEYEVKLNVRAAVMGALCGDIDVQPCSVPWQ